MYTRTALRLVARCGAGTGARSLATASPIDGFEMMVCDMAGTTVEEGGVVYSTLREVMNNDGMDVSEAEMHPWHGARKESVLAHFAAEKGTPSAEIEARISRCSDEFNIAIDAKYAAEGAVSLIVPELPQYLTDLKKMGVKMTLNTGFPAEIQEGLMSALGLNSKDLVDAHISAYTVPEGRPYPYMVHRLMEECGVSDVRKVVKCGDSVRDIEEGKNAGCGLVVGVLSGADSEAALRAAGADLIVNNVTEIPLPSYKTV